MPSVSANDVKDNAAARNAWPDDHLEQTLTEQSRHDPFRIFRTDRGDRFSRFA